MQAVHTLGRMLMVVLYHSTLLFLLSLSIPHCVSLPPRVTNLKCWISSSVITNKTLQLLNDLSVGYSSVRKLVKLNTIQFILENHTVN